MFRLALNHRFVNCVFHEEGKENKLELQSWFHLNAVFLVGFFSPLVFLNTFVFRDASSFLQLGISPTFEPWTVSLPPAQG